jgi:hypothetical protein
MSKSNLAKLQEALTTKSSSKPSIVTPDTVAPAQALGSYMAPSRTGKVNITAYLSPDYKSNLRLIQARTGLSLQDLVAESLNDLFQKYDVPAIRTD